MKSVVKQKDLRNKDDYLIIHKKIIQALSTLTCKVSKNIVQS